MDSLAVDMERRVENLRQYFNESSWLLSLNIGHEGGVYVHTCGHYLHLDCHKQYLQSLKSQQRQQSLNVERGEYSCPLCRQLANSALPIATQLCSKPSYSSRNASALVASERSVTAEILSLFSSEPPLSLDAGSKLMEAMGHVMEDMTNATYPRFRQVRKSFTFAILLPKWIIINFFFFLFSFIFFFGGGSNRSLRILVPLVCSSSSSRSHGPISRSSYCRGATPSSGFPPLPPPLLLLLLLLLRTKLRPPPPPPHLHRGHPAPAGTAPASSSTSPRPPPQVEVLPLLHPEERNYLPGLCCPNDLVCCLYSTCWPHTAKSSQHSPTLNYGHTYPDWLPRRTPPPPLPPRCAVMRKKSPCWFRTYHVS